MECVECIRHRNWRECLWTINTILQSITCRSTCWASCPRQNSIRINTYNSRNRTSNRQLDADVIYCCWWIRTCTSIITPTEIETFNTRCCDCDCGTIILPCTYVVKICRILWTIKWSRILQRDNSSRNLYSTTCISCYSLEISKEDTHIIIGAFTITPPIKIQIISTCSFKIKITECPNYSRSIICISITCTIVIRNIKSRVVSIASSISNKPLVGTRSVYDCPLTVFGCVVKTMAIR